MKVFISWSKPRSKMVAQALHNWLPKVCQSVEPWMSEEDIKGGSLWLNDLMEVLREAKFGIFCITPENQNSPWLHFEAGAISKAIGKNLVCPYLISLKEADFKGNPLINFQYRKSDK